MIAGPERNFNRLESRPTAFLISDRLKLARSDDSRAALPTVCALIHALQRAVGVANVDALKHALGDVSGTLHLQQSLLLVGVQLVDEQHDVLLSVVCGNTLTVVWSQ